MRHDEIPLSKLFVSSLNTRKDLQAGQEDSGITDLAASIRKQGLLNPLIVRPVPDGRYEVLTGQRRLVACQQIGSDPVPCLVGDDINAFDDVVCSFWYE